MVWKSVCRGLPVPGRLVVAAVVCLGATAVPAQVLLTPEELFAVARSAAGGAQPDPARATALLDRIEAEHPASDLAALIRLYRDGGLSDEAVIASIDARLAGAPPAPPPAALPGTAPGTVAPGFATAVPAPAAPSVVVRPAPAPLAPAPLAPAPLAPAPQAAAPPAPLAPAPPPAAAFETDETLLRLTREDRREVQGRLNSLGYAAGTPDGVFGPRSRAAIAEWQVVEGIAPTGFLSAAQLALLRQTSAMSYPQWLAAQPAPRATRPARTTQSTGNRWRATNDPCAVRPTDSRGQLRRECDRR